MLGRVLEGFRLTTNVIVMFMSIVATWAVIKYIYWKSRSNVALRRLATIVARDQAGSVDLELATTDQIIEELLTRPNSRFMLLMPQADGEHLHVEIHAANLPVEMALAILKSTYEGVVESLGEEDDDEDDDDMYPTS